MICCTLTPARRNSFGRNWKRGSHHSPDSYPWWRDFVSVQAISWVIEHSKQKANPFVVLLMIANHARSDGSGAWPSVHTLAKECRLGDRTVQRAIRALAETGELRVRIGKGPYGANLYDLPGVRLTPGGVKRDREGCQTGTPGGDRAVSPNPSLTVHKDKEGMLYRITSERTRQYLTASECAAYEDLQ